MKFLFIIFLCFFLKSKILFANNAQRMEEGNFTIESPFNPIENQNLLPIPPPLMIVVSQPRTGAQLSRNRQRYFFLTYYRIDQNCSDCIVSMLQKLFVFSILFLMLWGVFVICL